MLRRSTLLLSLIALIGIGALAPAEAAIGNGMEPIVVEPWLPVVADAPAAAPRQCRLVQRQVRLPDRAGKLQLRTVQRSTCRA